MIADPSNLHLYTVNQIKTWAKQNDFKPPSGLNKQDLIRYLQGLYTEKNTGVLKGASPQTRPISSLEPQYADPNIDWLTHLHEHGWAVTPIDGWQPRFIDDFFTFLESCSPNFDRNDLRTWKANNMPIMSHGVLKHYFGQSELQWLIRELCVPIFSRIWNCTPEELLCSFDGGCFLPTIPKRSDNDPFKVWSHVDQDRNDRNFSCVQGVVNFIDNGPEDGGLVLIEGSHKIFGEYMDKHPSYGIVWELADINDSLLSTKKMIKICAPAGSIILWDSRIMHSNVSPSGSYYKEDNTPRYRMCCYVSMQPRVGATQKELDKRKSLYEKGRQTGHSCYGYYFAETSEHPHTYGGTNNKPQIIEIAPLNPLRSKLIGY